MTCICCCKGAYKHFPVDGSTRSKAFGDHSLPTWWKRSIREDPTGMSLASRAEGTSIYWACTKCWAHPFSRGLDAAARLGSKWLIPFYRPGDWGPEGERPHLVPELKLVFWPSCWPVSWFFLCLLCLFLCMFAIKKSYKTFVGHLNYLK